MGELNFGRILRRTTVFADRTAVTDLGTGHEGTYAQQLDRIGHLCGVLRELGLSGDDRVGVMAGGSHVYIELWQACLAGAALINPINTRLAPDELVHVLTDSGTTVMFVDATFAPVVAELRDRLPELRQVVLIETAGATDVRVDSRLGDLLAATEDRALPAEPDDDAPAVLMYTGGTTGRPKGVVLPQRAIALVIYRMHIAAPLGGDVRYLAFLPMFHIAGVSAWGLFPVTGGVVVVQPVFQPAQANEVIRDQRITHVGAVPTMFAMMLQDPDFEPSMFESLRLVMYGAAPMPSAVLDRMMATWPDLEFFQAYGMTECAATVTALDPDDHRRGGERLRSVGRPCVGVDLTIRTPGDSEPVPTGEIGEIWVRCDSVMSEYWNQPEVTAGSLVDGWYRTGDAGRLDDLGYLFLEDRVKDMIVSGGENVYSIEVENAIGSHPAVKQVAVVGVPDETWGELVHAVVVIDQGAVSAAELATHTRDRIAGYKVPKGWTFRTEPLPLSAAGKVLKRALRDEVASA
jgi:long-chain acyl-CoA synthetase